jgi:hypothetical protein
VQITFAAHVMLPVVLRVFFVSLLPLRRFVTERRCLVAMGIAQRQTFPDSMAPDAEGRDGHIEVMVPCVICRKLASFLRHVNSDKPANDDVVTILEDQPAKA